MILADVPARISDALDSLVRWLGYLSVLDWILVGAAAAVIVWGWMSVAARARLGTIELEDFAVDGTGWEPVAAKAQLQEQLAQRGWLPASGVPSGTPTADTLEKAITAAPLPQVNWLGALIALIPTPPSSTRFKISTTLRSAATAGKDVTLSYKLVRVAPQPRVVVKELPVAEDVSAAVRLASVEIYRSMAKLAPDIYPAWSRFSSAEAQLLYRDALDAEKGDGIGDEQESRAKVASRYREAYESYCAAMALDPDNMLIRLRAASCVEREASALGAVDGIDRSIDALAAYVSIRLREPTIFEASFRTSVLLNKVAALDVDEHCQRLERARRILLRLERAGANNPAMDRRLVEDVAKLTLPELQQRLFHAGRRERRRARHRLLRWWMFVCERRLRHRLEPTGAERKQLARAIGVSRACARARRWQLDGASDLTQYLWRSWIFCRFMAGRQRVAGWQANYNAACFHALLPNARSAGAPLGSWRVRRRALHYLRSAIDQADGELACGYVRDEDPDLESLRELSPIQFELELGRLCPDDLVVRYVRPASGENWGLHVWGEAVMPTAGRPWNEPLEPVKVTASEIVYRIRIVDENRQLHFLAHRGEERDVERCVVPAALPNRTVWVHPGDERLYFRGPGLLEVRYRGPTARPRLVATGPAVEARGVLLPQPESPIEATDGEATYRIGLMDPAKPVVLTLEHQASTWELVPGDPWRQVWLLDGDSGVFDGPSSMLTVHSTRPMPVLRRFSLWPSLHASGPAAQHGPRPPVTSSGTEATYHVVIRDAAPSVALQLEDATGKRQSKSVKMTRQSDGWTKYLELPVAPPDD